MNRKGKIKRIEMIVEDGDDEEEIKSGIIPSSSISFHGNTEDAGFVGPNKEFINTEFTGSFSFTVSAEDIYELIREQFENEEVTMYDPKDYRNTIINMAYRVSRTTGHRVEDMQVMIGNAVFDSLKDEMWQKGERTIESKVRLPSSDGGLDDSTWDTVGVYQLAGMIVYNDPRLEPGEIILLDTEVVNAASGTMSPVITNPEGIEYVKTNFVEEGDRETCSHCGEESEITIEGDEGEPYCSIDCLNNAYNP